MRRGFTFLAIALVGIAAVTHADGPQPGLDPRVSIGAYMNGNLPTQTADPMPLTLSQTGVMSDTPLRTLHPGFVPYELNSPLWTDGAEKSRAIAIPYNSADPNNPVASPRIGFAPAGSWAFPNGTVIVKNFDMKVDESPGASYPVRRLETRILIRNADGTIRGATYRWRLPVNGVYTDADLITAQEIVPVVITQADGVSTRSQNYTYPGPSDCVRCHNANAGMVLGIRTSQLNGNLNYPSTGRTDNQLHTWDQIGMLNTPLADPSTYARSVDIADTTATLEHRARSYLASNCSHCHRPGGEGPYFDMRFETQTLDTHLFDTGVDPFGIGLIRDNHLNSRLYVRDSALPGNTPGPMPPLARNVPDQRVLDVYNQWVNYDYDVISATRLGPTQVRLLFNRAIDPASAATAANYALNNGATVTQATMDIDPAAVVLTTSPLAVSTTYTVTINRVKETQAPQNPIWPNTAVSFTTPGPTVPDAPVLTGIQAGNGAATLTFTPPGSNGGAAISLYTASCTSAQPATVTGTNANSPVTVNALTNGTLYTCSVRATNSVGEGPASNTLTVTPAIPVPALMEVFSRKSHVGIGDFDLPLNRMVLINGAVSVEPRGEATHRIVFRFDIPLSSPGLATTTIGTVSQTSIGGALGNEVIVTLTGISDTERATISLTDVNGAGVNATVSLGFLIGDVNGTRKVDATDLTAIKVRAGQPANADNFWFDINLSGSVTASEVSAVKARSNNSLQP